MSETILTKRRSKKIWKVWSEVALHATITLAVHKVFVMVVTLTQSAVLLYHGFASLSHSIYHKFLKYILKTGHLKKRQIYFTTHKMVQMSNKCIINGLPMHQIFILKLFELHRVQISVLC